VSDLDQSIAENMKKSLEEIPHPSLPKGSNIYGSTKIFPDYKANPGDRALVALHTVPYEGSVGLVNLLTATRLARKGFGLTIVLYGPGVLIGSGSRGWPTVGAEGFPGALAMNNQLKTIMKEGSKVYACRFAMDMIPGIKPFHPLDVLDSLIENWRAGALILNTWTV
jgi:uncharacterized repeat protein (TIGR04044 family)